MMNHDLWLVNNLQFQYFKILTHQVVNVEEVVPCDSHCVGNIGTHISVVHEVPDEVLTVVCNAWVGAHLTPHRNKMSPRLTILLQQNGLKF